MECKYCNNKCRCAGRQQNGMQRLYCKGCKKFQQQAYKYKACSKDINESIGKLVCEGVGIRSAARILGIAATTVMKKIKAIAASIAKPAIPMDRKCFELDELRTFVRRKRNECWVAYAICSHTKQVVDFIVGRRSKRTLKMITGTLLLSGVETVKTDKLNIYKSLIPAERHKASAYCINSIERNNLNLRTHLKRLSRKTICFSKSREMLEACLKIYFWKNKLLSGVHQR
ncbi:MAG TPA: IS1 family transposase [Puia sp.]|nr:IS1 family transposase [Puia sp.]